MVEFLAHSTDFWYGVSFVLFVGLVFKPAKRALAAALDAKIQEIADKVGEAKSLLDKTEAMHEQAKRAADALDKECATLLANTACEAADTAARLLTSLDEELARRRALTEQNIKEAVQGEILRIQLLLGDGIIAATRRLLRGEAGGGKRLDSALNSFRQSEFGKAS